MEWDEAREHDVMFLVRIESPEVAFDDMDLEGEDGKRIPFPQAHGVRIVRGLEVSARLDADGKEVRNLNRSRKRSSEL